MSTSTYGINDKKNNSSNMFLSSSPSSPFTSSPAPAPSSPTSNVSSEEHMEGEEECFSDYESNPDDAEDLISLPSAITFYKTADDTMHAVKENIDPAVTGMQ
ncbi:hypothetical protein AJ78_00445 [Emergomyces pasteurianus Ep9510]|uniref:Uncharacterized protein n=1 Tax=Emergomyces pasteurianus Ep9510 TaxID=1447872 RepID=A0A1J9QUN9_9EURO|nr:hypothetical protein AJ78_00445 [Emergomyces pasteurianus Ep9510]